MVGKGGGGLKESCACNIKVQNGTFAQFGNSAMEGSVGRTPEEQAAWDINGQQF